MAARFQVTGQSGQQCLSLARATSPRGGGPIRGQKSDEALVQQCMPGWLWGNPHGVAAEQAPVGRDVSPVRLNGVPNDLAMCGEGALQPQREGSPFQRHALPRRRELPLQQLPKVHQACLRDVSMGLPVECEGPLVHEHTRGLQRTQRETSPVRTEPGRLQSTLFRPILPCRGDVALQAMGCEATPVGTSSSAASGRMRTNIGNDCHTCALQPPLQRTTRQPKHELTKLSSFQIQVSRLSREGKLGLVLRGTSIVAVNTTWAAQLGFAPGQELLAINGSPVTNYQDLSRVISSCLATGPAIFDLVVSQPTPLLMQAEAATPRLSAALGVVTPPASNFHQSALANVQRPHAFPQTPLLRSPAAAARNFSPTPHVERESRQQQTFMRGGMAGAELRAADTSSSGIVNQQKPSLPSPDEMLQQVLSAATAGVCLPLPRSDLQRQQCKATPRAFSPTGQDAHNLVVQPMSDMFVVDRQMSTNNSCVSSTVVPPAHVGSGSIEQSSVALSATSGLCSADVGGLGLSSYVVTSLQTPTGEATQTTLSLNTGARLLAGAAADCLPNVCSMEDPTGDLPLSSTEVPNEACWRYAPTSLSEAGKATGQHNKALDAQLEVARMAEQAHQDGWLPEQAQQHVAWMAEQTKLVGRLEAAN